MITTKIELHLSADDRRLLIALASRGLSSKERAELESTCRSQEDDIVPWVVVTHDGPRYAWADRNAPDVQLLWLSATEMVQMPGTWRQLYIRKQVQ